jgi:3-oxoadipate enol-lactonase
VDPEQEFAAVDGTRLYYEVAGSGEPLVLIHGFALDMHMWDDQFIPFAGHHRAIRYDLRGFGKSAVPDEAPYAHADDLAALLDYLGVPRTAIVGLSLGGEVAIDFALAYPDRTHALILADAAVGGHRWSDAWKADVRPVWRTARTDGIEQARVRWLDQPIFTPAHEHPALATRLSAMVHAYSGWHWVNRDPHRNADPLATERLASIGVPTLVLLGERDVPDFHVMADCIATGIPGARKTILSDVGHTANMEAPARFNAEVLQFLAQA